MSLSSYLISREREPAPFVAIPAFVSRSFRHNGIYVSPASGISAPADLAGRGVRGGRDAARVVAIPAFVSRSFRHNGIYVSPASGISAPADLAGRVVGVAEY